MKISVSLLNEVKSQDGKLPYQCAHCKDWFIDKEDPDACPNCGCPWTVSMVGVIKEAKERLRKELSGLEETIKAEVVELLGA